MTRRIFIANAAVATALSIGVACAQQVLINAGGATFPYPIYSKWFDEYHKKFPGIAINYASIGSGGGIAQVTAGTVDFGASDGPMTDKAIQEFQTKRGSAILHFPTVLGADVPVYNIPGVTAPLNFTGDALAGIYLGKIAKWNDPAIASVNPGVKLPANNIVVVHRSDNSGTSFIWTDFLSKVNKEWEMKVGRGTGVNWPVGLGGKGNEGVSGSVQQTANSIGYVELAYAIQNKMPYGKVKNAEGEFIQASLASVTAAAAGMKDLPEDFRVSITNAPGKGVYPISSFTWLLIPSKIQDPAKKKAIKEFLAWMLADGQKLAEPLLYAPLPKTVIAKELKAIDKIQ
jgi:phosphate transport system substrate-binding protein